MYIATIKKKILDLSRAFCGKIVAISDWLWHLKYSLRNLTEVNLNLGLYHMRNNNINDAIFRFKIMNIILRHQNSDANHYLAICYLLKGNLDKSSYYAKLSSTSGVSDYEEFNVFLKNIYNIDEVPSKIWLKLMEFKYKQNIKELVNPVMNIPYIAIREIFDSMKEVDSALKIINIGLDTIALEKEIDKILNKSYELDFVTVCQTLRSCDEEKYDIAISLYGIDFARDLGVAFLCIYRLLKRNGYCVVMLKISDDSSSVFNVDKCCFEYSINYIESKLGLVGFDIVSIKELTHNNMLFLVKK